MKRPKIILFDYGQTIMEEGVFNNRRGNEAVLALAKNNPYHVTSEKLQELAGKLMNEIQKGSRASGRQWSAI